jgi:DNA adenine methylase
MEIKEQRIRPILRWAGGKTWMIDRINNFLPKEFNTYHEPFLGGASVFLNIECNGLSYISDSNPELICFYNQVKYNLKNLILRLKEFKNTEKEYYKIRSSKPSSNLETAARFYYLNRMCFNGLYRVNQAGFYNVPYGYRDITLIDLHCFEIMHDQLQKSVITCCDFEDALATVKRGDFVFLDPPYTVAHNKNGFIEYNQKIFSWVDQKRLAECVKRLIKKQAFFVLTNAYHESIKTIYKNIGKYFEIERYSTISGVMKSRFKISELLITNCI